MDATSDKVVENSTPIIQGAPNQSPKKSFKMNKIIGLAIGFIGLVALFIGYLIFINPLPVYLIPMRIVGLKLGYKIFDDPRNLVYFLYPKEGKVVQEANGTVVWKNADESADNAVVTVQPAKDPMPENGCSELDKNIWECSGFTNESGNVIYSYFATQSNITYLVNFGIKQSGSLKLARAGDDIFFARLLQSLLISPNQTPVTGNAEFLGYKIKLPSKWSIQSALLEIDPEYRNDVSNQVEFKRDEYSISLSLLGGGRGYCSADTPIETGVIHDKELTISENIYRLDILNTTNKQKYLYLKDYRTDKEFKIPKYIIDLCQNNIQGGNSHEGGTRLGLINYYLPEDFDSKILEEMDGIIKDLAKDIEVFKKDSDSTSFNEACGIISLKSNGQYEFCKNGRDNQLKKSNTLILNHLSDNYSVSPDKTKMTVWKYSDDYYSKCIAAPGCGGPQDQTAYMIDVITGKAEKLIDSQSSSGDSIWSLDSQGVLLVSVEEGGAYYCTTECEFVTKVYCAEGCWHASFDKEDILYTDTSGKEQRIKFYPWLIERKLPGVPIYPNSKFVGARTFQSCDVAIKETMDRMGYDKEAATILVGGRCDGTEYNFSYDGIMKDIVSWYEKDVSKSGYELFGGAGVEGINRFGQLSSESKRYDLTIQKGGYQITKNDRFQ